MSEGGSRGRRLLLQALGVEIPTYSVKIIECLLKNRMIYMYIYEIKFKKEIQDKW